MSDTAHAMSSNESVKDIYIRGLKNLHAVENQAIEAMERQVERLQHYPAMEARLRQHIVESQNQAQRLEQILHAHGEDKSALKDFVTSIMGNMAAIAHAPAGDEILKNTFANAAIEAYEIAAYKGLITMAEAAGDTRAIPLLQTSLAEEVDTAKFIDAHIADTVRTYMTRESSGMKADR